MLGNGNKRPTIKIINVIYFPLQKQCNDRVGLENCQYTRREERNSRDHDKLVQTREDGVFSPLSIWTGQRQHQQPLSRRLWRHWSSGKHPFSCELHPEPWRVSHICGALQRFGRGRHKEELLRPVSVCCILYDQHVKIRANVSNICDRTDGERGLADQKRGWNMCQMPYAVIWRIKKNGTIYVLVENINVTLLSFIGMWNVTFSLKRHIWEREKPL